MYACGAAVYGLIHIGNARPLVAFDVVYRHLKSRFPRVTYVRNITDVDDKIIKRAAEGGEDPKALAARFTAEFRADAAALGCLPPDVEPQVTTHIGDIVALIERLVARGVAYVTADERGSGDVWFDVARFPGYGQLAGQ